MHIMKQIKTFALIALLLAAPAAIAAQNNEQPTITQTAKAQRDVTPDELFLTITINEKDNKGKTTVEEQQKKMIDVLKNAGVDVEKNLTLNFMGSQISYTTFRRNVNPRTTATYMLKLHDAGTMQSIIAKLEAQGITNIQLTGTKYSKAEELCNELGAEAMKKAKAQAANLAAAVGQSIGPAIEISSWNSNNGSTPILYKARSNTMLSEVNIDDIADGGPQIEIGKITFSVNVTVKFLLNEK